MTNTESETLEFYKGLAAAAMESGIVNTLDLSGWSLIPKLPPIEMPPEPPRYYIVMPRRRRRRTDG